MMRPINLRGAQRRPGRCQDSFPGEALLLPLYLCSQPHTRTVLLFSAQQKHAHWAVSLTQVRIPIEILLHTGPVPQQNHEENLVTSTHTYTHIWEGTEWVGRWVWFSLQGGKKGKAPHPTSSHMRATFLNMQLCYHRRREGSWEGVKEGGGMGRI